MPALSNINPRRPFLSFFAMERAGPPFLYTEHPILKGGFV
jgi:hypothetical protein